MSYVMPPEPASVPPEHEHPAPPAPVTRAKRAFVRRATIWAYVLIAGYLVECASFFLLWSHYYLLKVGPWPMADSGDAQPFVPWVQYMGKAGGVNLISVFGLIELFWYQIMGIVIGAAALTGRRPLQLASGVFALFTLLCSCATFGLFEIVSNLDGYEFDPAIYGHSVDAGTFVFWLGVILVAIAGNAQLRNTIKPKYP